MPHKLSLFALFVAAGLFSGCDSPGGTTPPPPPGGPTLVCPSDVAVKSETGAAVAGQLRASRIDDQPPPGDREVLAGTQLRVPGRDERRRLHGR